MPAHRKPLIDPNDPRHGTRSAYLYHRCRCYECVDANRRYFGRSPKGSPKPKFPKR